MSRKGGGLMAFAYYPTAWSIFHDLNGELSSSQRIVLLAICDYANAQTGQCWPSHATLARLTGLSPRTVQKAVRELHRTHGLIERTPRRNENGGRSSDLITLRIAKAGDSTPMEATARGVELSDRGATNEVLRALEVVADEPRIEPRKQPKSQVRERVKRKRRRRYVSGPCASSRSNPADPSPHLALVDLRPEQAA